MNYLQPRLLLTALIAAILCAVGGVGSALGTKFGLWGFSVGFGILRWSVYLAIAAAGLAVLSAILALAAGKGLKDIRYLVVLVIAGIIFGVPYTARQEFRKFPTIADATTNFDDAPTFIDLVAIREETAKNPLEFRGGETIDRQKEHFPDLVTLRTDQTPADVIASAEKIAKDLGWAVASARPEQGRLEATATTFWFGFEDDVVVRARSSETSETLVDVRSASRVGFLDGGANAKRVQEMLTRLSN